MKRYKGIRESEIRHDCEIIHAYLKKNESIKTLSFAIRLLIKEGKITNKRTITAHYQNIVKSDGYQALRKELDKRVKDCKERNKRPSKKILLEKIDRECELIEKYIQENRTFRLTAVKNLQKNGMIRDNIKASSHLNNLHFRTWKNG